jgi:hypothetical protein
MAKHIMRDLLKSQIAENLLRAKRGQMAYRNSECLRDYAGENEEQCQMRKILRVTRRR